MRYAIFSDIHSNREALDAVLEAIRVDGVDQVVCAGDLVGYAAEPEAVVAAVRAAAHAVVAGNHDWAAAGRISLEWFHPVAHAAMVWTTTQLSDPTRQYLAALPLTWRDAHVTVAHGTLHEPEQFHYLLDADVATRSLALQETPVAFVGHTHVPIVFSTTPDGDVRMLYDRAVTVQPGRRYLVNVGSVGQPRDHQPTACYCLYDTERQRLEFRRVPYAVSQTQAKIRAAGLPDWLADRLTRGN